MRKIIIQALIALDICIFGCMWLYTLSYFLEHMSLKHLGVSLLSLVIMLITTYHLDRIENKCRR